MKFNIYKIINLCLIFNLNIFFNLSSNNAYINSIAIDQDNKIVAGGFYYSGDQFNFGNNTVFTLARYNPDGTLDTTFNANGGQPGIVVTQITPPVSVIANSTSPTDIITAPYLAIPPITDVPPTDVITYPIFAIPPIIDILPGNIITSPAFAIPPITDIQPGNIITEPIIPISPVTNVLPYDLLSAPANLTPQVNSILPYTTTLPIAPIPDLALPLFNIDNFITNPISEVVRDNNIAQNISEINGIAIDSKNRIVAVGYVKRNIGTIANSTDTDDSYFAVARYNPDGMLDTTFNPSGTLSGIPGIAITQVDTDDVLTSVVIDSQDNIIAAGYLTSFTNVLVTVAKYLENGDLDTTFNPNGAVSGIPGVVVTNISADPLISQSGLINMANAVALDSQGRILICGSATISTYTGILVVRYNPDGSLDTTLNPSGIGSLPGSVITSITQNSNGYAIGYGIKTALINGAEKIIVTGSTEAGGFNGNTTHTITIRYNEDGTLDPTFNGPDNLIITSENLPPIDQVIIPNGIVITPIGTISSYANALVIDDTILDNIKTIITGYVLYTVNPNIAINTDIENVTIASFLTLRYNQDGSLDTTFNPQTNSGYIITDIVNGALDAGFQTDCRANAIALDQNNEIVIAGGALNGSYINDFALAKYLNSGALDTTFNPTGTPPGTVITVVNNGVDTYKDVFMGGTVTQAPRLSSIEVTPEEAAEVSAQFSAFNAPVILTPENSTLLKVSNFTISGSGQPNSVIDIIINNDNNRDHKINIAINADKIGKWNTDVEYIPNGLYTISASSKDPISNLIFDSNNIKINVNNEKNKSQETKNLKFDLTSPEEIETSGKTALNFKIKDNPINIFIGSGGNIDREKINKLGANARVIRNKTGANIERDVIRNKTGRLDNKNILKTNIKSSNNLNTPQISKETLIRGGKSYYISYGNLDVPYVVSH